MKESEIITDLLLTEKKMSTNYNLFASECTNVQLRDAFVNLLTQGHKTQTQLFETAKAEQKYSNQAPTLTG